MIRVSCPTGCGLVQRPFARAAEPVRCGNCRAWFRAPARVEDASLVHGELLAAPGEAPPAPPAPPRDLRWLGAVLPAMAGSLSGVLVASRLGLVIAPLLAGLLALGLRYFLRGTVTDGGAP